MPNSCSKALIATLEVYNAGGKNNFKILKL